MVMMLDTLRHRCEFFAVAPLETVGPLTTRVEAVTRPYAGIIPSGTLAAIKADLVYAVARHDHWRQVPLFVDVLTDYLVREYQLTNKIAAALAIGAVAADCQSVRGPDGHVPPTDCEFLRYIFVASATAACESALTADLGIGSALITRIRETVQATVTGRTNDGTIRFLPELDAQISEILIELATEAKTMPWALAVHKLRYHLIDVPAPLGPWLKVHGARALFDLLLAIGSRGSASLRQIAHRLKRVGQGFDGDNEEVASLLAALAGVDLVFVCDSSDDENKVRYQLTPLAQELTADAFARNLTNTTRAPWTLLNSLCGPYQAALIRALAAPDVEILTQIAEFTRPLSPAGLRAVFDRLHEIVGADAVSETARRMANNDASPWLRRVAEHYLG